MSEFQYVSRCNKKMMRGKIFRRDVIKMMGRKLMFFLTVQFVTTLNKDPVIF